MRVLMTSILCQSGLMTHVNDLAKYLHSQGMFVAIAFRRVDYLDEPAQNSILGELHTMAIPHLLYDSTEELLEFLRAQECNLIHAHSHATFQTATEASLSQGVPLICTLHSVYPWQHLFGATLHVAQRIIAVGPAQAYGARRFSEKISIVQNAIDTKHFVPKTPREKQGDLINILWYGRVDGRLTRGLHTLDRVAPLLPKHIRITGLGTAQYVPINIPLISWTDHPLPFLQQSQITFAHGRSLREAMSAGSIGMLLGCGYGGMVTERRLTEDNLILDAFPEYRLRRPRVHKLVQDILTIAGLDLEQLRREARSIAERHFDLEDMGAKIGKIYRGVLS